MYVIMSRTSILHCCLHRLFLPLKYTILWPTSVQCKAYKSRHAHFAYSRHSQVSLLLLSSFFTGSFHMAKSSKRRANWLSLPLMHHLIFPVLLYFAPLLLVHKSQLKWLPSLSPFLSLCPPSCPTVRCSGRKPFISFFSVPCPPPFPLSFPQSDSSCCFYPFILHPALHGVIRSKLIEHQDAWRAGCPRSGPANYYRHAEECEN